MVLHQQYLNKKRAFAHQKKPSFSGNLRTNLIKSYCCVGILHKRTPRLTATRMFQFYPLWGSETFSESVTMTCVISVPQVCPRGGGSGIPTGYLFPLGREFDNSMWLGGREDCQGSLRGLRDEWKNKWSTAISAGDFFQFSRVDVLKVFCFYVDFNHFFFCYSPLLDIYPMGREIWLTLT